MGLSLSGGVKGQSSSEGGLMGGGVIWCGGA